MTWAELGVLAALGYLQRMGPWVLAGRTRMPPRLASWLRYVSPAAFATLLVSDIQRVTVATLAALAAAALVSWRTKNLGLAVLGAVGVSWVVLHV